MNANDALRFAMSAMLSFTVACDGDASDASDPLDGSVVAGDASIRIHPRVGTPDPGESVLFTAIVTGSEDTTVTWRVEEEDGGSITSDGTYTAPSREGIFHVTATSRSNPAVTVTVPVSTRRTPPATWNVVTGNLSGMQSECGNVSAVASHPTRDVVITDVALHGLWGLEDGQSTWQPLGQDGDVITNRTSWITFDPANPDVFYESGIYNGGGVYKTVDGGMSFTQLGTITHNDSVAVDFTDPARQTLIAGPHEQSRTLWLSTNGGAAWTNIGSNLPEDSGHCTLTAVIDARTFLVGCGGWGDGRKGIFRTEDAGASWSQVHASGVASQPLLASDGAIYWAGDSGGLVRSVDAGETWQAVGDGSISRALPPVELPDGRLVTMGSNTLMISSDKGDDWEPIAASALPTSVPFFGMTMTYSPFRKAFLIAYFTCDPPVPSDALQQFGFR